MSALRKVMCPIDFSDEARHAMRVAIRIANDAGAELVLAHAWQLPAFVGASEYPLPGEAVQAFVDDAERLLADAAAEAKQAGASRVGTLFASGVPWLRIVEALRDDPAIDLVVMGTHGRSGVRRFLLGSVAEQVIRHAPCPVLAVRGDHEPARFRRILVPVDFSDDARRAAELAVAIAPPSASLTLLHVVEPPPASEGALLVSDLIGAMQSSAGRALEQWATELRAKTAATITTTMRVGHAAAQALAILDEDPTFDLVVTGSHGRTGIRRVLLGSVAEKILRHASCPVLVARSRTQTS